MTCLTRYRWTFTILLMIIISTVGDTIDEAKAILITETEAAINWIKSNQMIANSEKFHLMFLSANENNKLQRDLVEK